MHYKGLTMHLKHALQGRALFLKRDLEVHQVVLGVAAFV